MNKNDIEAAFIALGEAFKTTAEQVNQLFTSLQNVKLKDDVDFSLTPKIDKPWYRKNQRW